MKGLIVFKGKYGATKQYAQWISDELGIASAAASSVEAKEVRQADFLIIGTSVYIGKLQIGKWLRKHIAELKGKKIFLFLVAGTPPEKKKKLDEYISTGVPGELRTQCSVFYLPGRLRIAGLSWKDRIMLKMGARLTKDPGEKKAMLTDYDKVTKDNLKELLFAVKAQFPVRSRASEPVLL